jgi:hypothetical protein
MREEEWQWQKNNAVLKKKFLLLHNTRASMKCARKKPRIIDKVAIGNPKAAIKKYKKR